MKKIIMIVVCIISFCSCGVSSEELMSGTYVTIVDLDNANYGFDFSKDNLDDYLITAMEGTSSSGFFTFDNGDFLFETSYRSLTELRYFYERKYEISDMGRKNGGIRFRMGGAYCRKSTTNHTEAFIKLIPLFQLTDENGDSRAIYLKGDFCTKMYMVLLLMIIMYWEISLQCHIIILKHT